MTVPTISCNLCGGKRAEQISNLDRHRKPLGTVICRYCGLVWTDPRPDQQANRKFYQEEYRLQYKSTYTPRLKHVYRETKRAIERFRLIEHLLSPGTSLLDVGCGGGFFLYVAGQMGVSGQGIEPNQGFAEYANAVMGVTTTNAFLQDVEHSPESFDLITLNHVLEHVEDPTATLTRLKMWLKPNGLLVVEVPNIEATYHAPKNRYHVGHLYNFNPATLERLGTKVGLAVRESKLVTPADHIHVVFENSAAALQACSNQTLSGNYKRVSAILQRHTTLAHYVSTVPYLRLLGKQAEYLGEQVAIRGHQNPQQLANDLIHQFFHSRRSQAA